MRTLSHDVEVKAGKVVIKGILSLPENATGIVLFAHGSGSGRLSPRNQLVAKDLNEKGLGTLLIDLLTEEEEKIDDRTRELRFDIPFLAERLIDTIDWMAENKETQGMRIGLFGASTGAAAALVADAKGKGKVSAIVSRGGRPDLAGSYLEVVKSPTLLIVGGNDFGVIELNEGAYKVLNCEKKLEIVPGATHLFEEPGALATVCELAETWFLQHL